MKTKMHPKNYYLHGSEIMINDHDSAKEAAEKAGIIADKIEPFNLCRRGLIKGGDLKKIIGSGNWIFHIYELVWLTSNGDKKELVALYCPNA